MTDELNEGVVHCTICGKSGYRNAMHKVILDIWACEEHIEEGIAVRIDLPMRIIESPTVQE